MSRLVVLIALLAACGAKPAPKPAAFPSMPAILAPAAWAPTITGTFALKSGVSVTLVEDHSLPLVSVRIVLPRGAAHDPASKAGLATLGATMLEQGAGGRTALEQAASFDRLAATFGISVGADSLSVRLDSHAERLAEGLALLADAVLRPSLTEQDWERVHRRHLTGVRARKDDNGAVAALVADRVVYGDTPYGRPAGGTEASVQAVALADVQAWHANLDASGVHIVVVGDVDEVGAKALLEQHLGGWAAAEAPKVSIAEPASKAQRIFVDRPDSTQTVFRIVMPGQRADAADRAALDAVGVVIGGSFTSRLNNRLREQLGYTYGARLGVSRLAQAGELVASAKIRTDATVDAMKEFTALLTAPGAEGFTDDEVDKGRSQILTDIVGSAGTRSALAGSLAGELAAGRDPAAIGDYVGQLKALDANALHQAARSWVRPDRATVVLVGDKAKVLQPLIDAGFDGWVEVDHEGNPLAP